MTRSPNEIALRPCCSRWALGVTTAMALLAAGLFTTVPSGQAADNKPSPQPNAEPGTPHIRVQPKANEFAPPNQPDIGADSARTIDTLYRELHGPQPSTSSGSRWDTPASSRATR
jgi:hypothetical protein